MSDMANSEKIWNALENSELTVNILQRNIHIRQLIIKLEQQTKH